MASIVLVTVYLRLKENRVYTVFDHLLHGKVRLQHLNSQIFSRASPSPKPIVLAEITRLCQYIGATIVYFSNRQGGSICRMNIQILWIFWEVHMMSLIQKVNQMRLHIGGVTAERNILSPLCLFVKTLPSKREQKQIFLQTHSKCK